jgi:spermidine synthase
MIKVKNSTGPLALCMFFSGYCGIVAELSLFTLAESLIGGTYVNLLCTMGVMMFSMGLGSWLSGKSWAHRAGYGSFISLELSISALCASAIPILLFISGNWPWFNLWSFAAFSAGIGTLIGMEIPLMQRLIQEEGSEDIQVIASRVMMADYFGSLVGFVFFSLILLHRWGLHWTALSGAALNFIIAATITLRPACPAWGKTVALAFTPLLLFMALQLETWMKKGEQGLYRHKILWQQQTPFQKLVLVDQSRPGNPDYNSIKLDKWQRQQKTIDRISWLSGNADLKQSKGHLSLFINGALQFNSRDEHIYHEHLVHPLFAIESSIENVLVMGGGDGMAIREILKHPHVKSIELVELDPAMTSSFQKHPELIELNQNALNHPKVNITHMDAWTWARSLNTKKDAIILDFPDPHHSATAKLYSLQFYKLLKENLSPKGLLITQATSPLYDPRGFGCIRRSLEESDFEVLSLHVEMASFGQWGFHIAHPDLSEADMKQRLLNWQLEQPFKSIDQHSIVAAITWPPRFFNAFNALPANDLFHLPLIEFYPHH